MEFYLKLACKEDDKKLEGIVLFEDFGKAFYKDCKQILTTKYQYCIENNKMNFSRIRKGAAYTKQKSVLRLNALKKVKTVASNCCDCFLV